MPFKDTEAKRAYQAEWQRNKRAENPGVQSKLNRQHLQEWLARYKVEQGCVDCGYNEHPDALEFDHVRGEKVANVANLVNRGMPAILEEIAKCEVRCANCHAIITAERRRSK